MHTVGVLNRIPMLGTDPVTVKQGDSEEPATVCAVPETFFVSLSFSDPVLNAFCS
jgi:hypothetical protein